MRRNKKSDYVTGEELALLRETIKYELKTAKDPVMKEELQKIADSLKGKKKITRTQAEEAEETRKLTRKATQEYTRKEWEAKRSQEHEKFVEKSAKKYKNLSDKEISTKFEKSYAAELLAYRAEQEAKQGSGKAQEYIKDYGDEEERKEVMLNYLGIGSHGIELLNKQLFTEDDLKECFEAYGLDMAALYQDKEIYNYKYNPTRYTKWKEDIYDKYISKLIARIKADLTQAENNGDKEKVEKLKFWLEGIERVFKIFGL
ncbi:hypothetical protein J6S88_06520 [bacterium]|nr:hypothetical protein [bacterium]